MKQEHIIDIATVVFTVSLHILLTLTIKVYYVPSPLPQNIVEFSNMIGTVLSITPEPVEFVQYVLNVLCAPLFLWLSYLTANHIHKNIHKKVFTFSEKIYIVSFILESGILIWLIYKSLQASNFLYIAGFPGNGSILFLYPILYTILIFPILMVLGYYFVSLEVSKLLVKLFCIYLIIVIFFFNIYSAEYLPVVYHFDVVFYSVTQVLQGKTLLMDLNATYGLYGAFLEPIFRIFELSVLNFSVVMALLVALSFYFIFMFLSQVVNNYFILLSGFAAVVFYNYLAFKVGSNEPYFQYTPIRFIFPCLVIYLSAIYSKTRSNIIYHFGFFISSIAILWNLETGIVVFLSWTLYLIYFELLNTIEGRALRKSLITIVVTGALTLSIVIYIYILYAFLRTGCFPDVGQAILYLKVYSAFVGVMTIPMPSYPHWWNVVVLVYLLGLLSSLKALYRKPTDAHVRTRQTAIFMLSIMGIGLFSYYQGRSHDYNLLMTPYPATLILILFADGLLEGLDKSKEQLGYINHRSLFLLIILYFFSNSLLSLFHKTGSLLNTIQTGMTALLECTRNTSLVSKNINFIKDHSHPNESVLVLTPDWSDGVYYGESSTRSVVDVPSSVEWLFKRDVKQITTFLLENVSHKVFIYPSTDYGSIDIAINQILKTRYEVAAQSEGGMVLLYPKSVDYEK